MSVAKNCHALWPSYPPSCGIYPKETIDKEKGNHRFVFGKYWKQVKYLLTKQWGVNYSTWSWLQYKYNDSSSHWLNKHTDCQRGTRNTAMSQTPLMRIHLGILKWSSQNHGGTESDMCLHVKRRKADYKTVCTLWFRRGMNKIWTGKWEYCVVGLQMAFSLASL